MIRSSTRPPRASGRFAMILRRNLMSVVRGSPYLVARRMTSGLPMAWANHRPSVK